MALTILILAISGLLIRYCNQTWNNSFSIAKVIEIYRGQSRRGELLKRDILFSAGDIVRKHKMVASTLYNIGVALINMRMYLRR